MGGWAENIKILVNFWTLLQYMSAAFSAFCPLEPTLFIFDFIAGRTLMRQSLAMSLDCKHKLPFYLTYKNKNK